LLLQRLTFFFTTKAVAKYMAKRNVPIATLQVQYHLLSRFPETNGTRETCDELGIR
jgi:pyridoxine 4-dehydrogenase|tara:strand:+ start:107 stop:274 length:168 start_codon:yes stop_codon:yes gene_type:complete